MSKKKKASDPEELKRQKLNSTQHSNVQVDVSFSDFIDEFTNESKDNQKRLLKKITSIQEMTWQDVYNTSSKGKGKRGLNWEVLDQKTADSDVVASIRIDEKYRARVSRDGSWMRFISLHPDHDSAYSK